MHCDKKLQRYVKKQMLAGRRWHNLLKLFKLTLVLLRVSAKLSAQFIRCFNKHPIRLQRIVRRSHKLQQAVRTTDKQYGI